MKDLKNSPDLIINGKKKRYNRVYYQFKALRAAWIKSASPEKEMFIQALTESMAHQATPVRKVPPAQQVLKARRGRTRLPGSRFPTAYNARSRKRERSAAGVPADLVVQVVQAVLVVPAALAAGVAALAASGVVAVAAAAGGCSSRSTTRGTSASACSSSVVARRSIS